MTCEKFAASAYYYYYTYTGYKPSIVFNYTFYSSPDILQECCIRAAGRLQEMPHISSKERNLPVALEMLKCQSKQPVLRAADWALCFIACSCDKIPDIARTGWFPAEMYHNEVWFHVSCFHSVPSSRHTETQHATSLNTTSCHQQMVEGSSTEPWNSRKCCTRCCLR